MIEESKIRERAYELWEKDGRSEGSEQFYWRLAQDQLGAEVQPSDDNSPNPVACGTESKLAQSIPAGI